MRDRMDLAERCVEFGMSLGCDYVEARSVTTRTRSFVYRNGQLISGGVEPSSGIGVRVLANGSIGFASFDRMERQLAEDAISVAYKMARRTRRK
ncbi:MAG: PmbA/TldA family metallopeptidase, partial [Candidatus Geothermarchaeales archaeon]